MKKILLALLLTFLIVGQAQALTDFCWPSYGQTAWTAMKNAGHWYWNYIAGSTSMQGPTIAKAYHDKIVPTQADADYAYNSLSQFCGSEAYLLTIDTGTDTLTDWYENLSKDNPIANNDQVKFFADVYPTGINGTTTYYVINASREYGTALNITGITKERSDIPNINIETSAAHNLKEGDEVYVQGVGGMTELNNKRFTVRVMSATKARLMGVVSEWPGGSYGNYTSGGTIKKITDTFQVSTSQGGSAIDFSDTGNAVYWYPASRPFNWKNGCRDMYRGATRTLDVSALTEAAQGVFTVQKPHGFATGETILLRGGYNSQNHTANYTVSDPTTYTFKLKSSGTYVDTSSWGTYSGGLQVNSEAVSYGDSNDWRGYYPWYLVTYTHFSQTARWTQTQKDMAYEILDAQWDKAFRQDTGYPPGGDTDSLYAFYWNGILWATVNNWLAGGPTSPSAGKYLDRYNEIVNYDYVTGNSLNVRGMGGLTWTGTDGNLRNKIHGYALSSAGGPVNTGSDYGQEIGPYFQYMKWLKDYYGTDYFTDFTDNAENMFAGMVHGFTPDFADQMHWGDSQSSSGIGRELFKLRPFLTGGWLSICNWVIQNKLFDSLHGHISMTHYIPFPEIDPYGTPSSFGLSGHTAYHAQSLPAPAQTGFAYYHTGWTSSDSYFASMNLGSNMGDHEPDTMSNFDLYRDGEWIIREVRMYYQGQPMNTVRLWGGVKCGVGCEARGNISYDADTTKHWMLHQGVIGGKISLGVTNAEPDNAPLKEFTDTHFAMRNADGSDTVIFLRRVDALDIRNAGNASSFYGDGTPDHQGYAGMSYGINVVGRGGKHTMEFWGVPSSGNITQNGDVLSWNSITKSVPVKLYNFIPGGFTYDTGSVTANDVTSYGIGILATDTTEGMHFYKQVLHAGSSTPTIAEIASSSGESADGLLLTIGSEKKAIIGNATKGAVLTDYSRTALRNKSYFKTGTTFTIPTTSAVEVHVIDLDPARTWTAAIDGGSAASITPSSSGVYSVDLSSSGSNHTITLASTSTCSLTDWRACTSSNCSTYNWYWWGNSCHDTAQCDAQHVTNCTSSGDCTGAGGYWWGGTCHTTAQPTCPSTCSLCATQGTCEPTCHWWIDNTCHTSAAPSCDDNCSLCSTSGTCSASQFGCYWYGNQCNSTPNSSPSGAEDLTTWTHGGTNDVYSITSAEAHATLNGGTGTSYLFKSLAPTNIGSFSFDFTFKGTEPTGGGAVASVFAVGNSSQPTASNLMAAHDGIQVYATVGSPTLYLREESTGAVSSAINVAWDTYVYCTLSRDNTNIKLQVYSNAGRTNLVTGGEVTLPLVSTPYQNVSILGSGSDGHNYTLWVKDVVLNIDQQTGGGDTGPYPKSVFGSCSIGHMN